MRYFLLILVAVALVGCGGGKQEETQGPSQPEPVTPPQATEKPKPPKAGPTKLIADPIVEKAIRIELKKPTGELTKADLAKVNKFIAPIRITDAGLKEVAKLKQLNSLGLAYTLITDAGLKEVAKLQQLTSLGLTDTQITDTGLKEVAKLQKLTGLSLRATKVTKAGVVELQKALPKCKIYGP